MKYGIARKNRMEIARLGSRPRTAEPAAARSGGLPLVGRFIAAGTILLFAGGGTSFAYSFEPLPACADEQCAGDVIVRLAEDGWALRADSIPIPTRRVLRDGLLAAFAAGRSELMVFSDSRQEVGPFLGRLTYRYGELRNNNAYQVRDDGQSVLFVTEQRDRDDRNSVICADAAPDEPGMYAFMLVQGKFKDVQQPSVGVEAVAISREFTNTDDKSTKVTVHIGRFTEPEPEGFGGAPRAKVGFFSVLSSEAAR